MTGHVSHSLVKALRGVPDFSGLDDHTVLRIAGASVNLYWRAVSMVFEKGRPSAATVRRHPTSRTSVSTATARACPPAAR